MLNRRDFLAVAGAMGVVGALKHNTPEFINAAQVEAATPLSTGVLTIPAVGIADVSFPSGLKDKLIGCYLLMVSPAIIDEANKTIKLEYFSDTMIMHDQKLKFEEFNSKFIDNLMAGKVTLTLVHIQRLPKHQLMNIHYSEFLNVGGELTGSNPVLADLIFDNIEFRKEQIKDPTVYGYENHFARKTD